MKHITFDLETLGTNFNSPIVQIAAVKFDNDGNILAEFDAIIKVDALKVEENKTILDALKSLQDVGNLPPHDFTIDASTIKWWSTQPIETIESVFCSENKVDINQALTDFMNWIDDGEKYKFWCHKDFDIVLINNHCNKLTIKNKIIYWNVEDIRTIQLLSEMKGKKIWIKRIGKHHNALDDCKHQVKVITKGFKNIL